MSSSGKPALQKPTTIKSNIIYAATDSKLRCSLLNMPYDMERWFKAEVKGLEWGETVDPMYSFKSIYALGVWAYNNESGDFEIKKYSRSSPKLRYKPNGCLVWNGDFLKRIQETSLVDDLNNNESMKEYAKHYFSIGNLMPIWPYGNEPKGNQNKYFFDIPELYYHYHRKWFDVICKAFDNVFLEDVFTDVEVKYDDGLETFLMSINNRDAYNRYLNHVLTVINKREQKIKKWMSDNNVTIKRSLDYPVD